MGGEVKNRLRGAGVFALVLTGALLFSCEQPAGPPAPGETPGQGESPGPEKEPVRYTAAANGVNGGEDSTAIVFTFEEDVADLRAGHISLANGMADGKADGTGGNGGSVVKGSLSGGGKNWSLGIAVQSAGSVTVRLNRAGIETGEKPVTVYKAGEQTLVGYSAAADGNSRKASAAINFVFGAGVPGLAAEDITITGGAGDGAGGVTKGALSGGGQNWSLAIGVTTPGDIKVGINKEGVETGEKTVTVYRPVTYAVTADGSGTASSGKIGFSFSADISGLTTGDISAGPEGIVTTGALTGGGANWSLGISALGAGDIKIRINKDGIEDKEKTVTVHYYKPAGYAAAANGKNGEEDSTAIALSFDGDVAGLSAEHIGLSDGTGSALKGALGGGGKEWSLGITVQSAGSVTVRIDKPGIETGEKTVTVYKAGEKTLAGYSAAADGGGRKASSAISLSFGTAVTGLAAADITVTGGTGSVTRGALSGGGQEWSLAIVVETPGDVRVRINRDGVEGGEKTVTVYRPVSYDAAADSPSGPEASGRIDLIFSAALADLGVTDISFADGTGSAYPLDLTGGGQEWALWIVVVKTGDIRVGIGRDGVEEGEKTVSVYRPEETPPPVAEKTGIAVISPPDITLYAKNQPFDRTGLELAWIYSDGSAEPIPAGAYELEEPDMGVPVTRRVNVQAGGYKTSFWIQILNTDKALVSVSAEGPANKTQDLGREFDRTGLTVTGHYSDGSVSNLTSLAAVHGYDKSKRGPQTVSVRVNGKAAPLPGITTRIGGAAAVDINAPSWAGLNNRDPAAYKRVYIKGEALSPETCNIRLSVRPGGGAGAVILSCANGGITQEEIAGITGYSPGQPGKQAPVFTLEGRSFDLNIIVIDTEPAAWFDYGYMRHDGDPEGAGKGAGIAEGKYYAKPGETLIIAPVRYLVGYNADHSDAGVTYNWTVSGGSWTTAGGGEFLRFTPPAAGTYNISVGVTGRSYVTGGNITKTASTKVVCFDNDPPGKAIKLDLKNYGPGQMAEKGTGYGWSLGSAGGYRVWSVEHRGSYKITGNAFAGWNEAGVVWAQEDRNGNGLPDEAWYELRGGDDDDPAWRDRITRRYALRYFDAGGGSTVNQYGQIIREIYWTDGKGRGGYMPGGFPSDWGVTGNWVTYTCTLLRDNGMIDTGTYGHYPMTGYVDAVGDTFYINAAMDLAGNPVTLTAVRFLKVQTGVFHYGGSFGDVSTEIAGADFLGKQTDFPAP
jgi:hypothetical protein